MPHSMHNRTLRIGPSVSTETVTMNADLVLEQLRVIRSDIATLKQQTHEDYQFLAARMPAMEQPLAALVTALPGYADRIDQLEKRLTRMERRLEISE